MLHGSDPISPTVGFLTIMPTSPVIDGGTYIRVPSVFPRPSECKCWVDRRFCGTRAVTAGRRSGDASSQVLAAT